MITREFADKFTQEWIASWNSRDLERILSHYTDDFEMSSPYIAEIAGESSGVLKGKAGVAAYWAKGLERMPTLHFELHSSLVGAESQSTIEVLEEWRQKSSSLVQTVKSQKHARTMRKIAYASTRVGHVVE
jgi:hypothetical protein